MHKLVADTAVRIAKRPTRSIHRSSTGEIECTPKLPGLAVNAFGRECRKLYLS